MLPLLLAAAAVPSIYKGIQGIAQGIQADHLKVRDTTPQAFRESLGLSRQAATAGLPGEGQQLNRLNAGTNNVLAAGARAGTSSSSILGLLGNADQTRARGLNELGARSDAYHQQQQRGLQGMLQQQAAYQTADRQEYDRNKAALKEASERNIFGALEGGSQVAAYGLNGGAAGAQPTAAGGSNILGGPVPPPVAPELAGYDQVNYLPGTSRPRYNYGVPTYASPNYGY
jgi:hypothetical protein